MSNQWYGLTSCSEPGDLPVYPSPFYPSFRCTYCGCTYHVEDPGRCTGCGAHSFERIDS